MTTEITRCTFIESCTAEIFSSAFNELATLSEQESVVSKQLISPFDYHSNIKPCADGSGHLKDEGPVSKNSRSQTKENCKESPLMQTLPNICGAEEHCHVTNCALCFIIIITDHLVSCISQVPEIFAKLCINSHHAR